VTQPNYKFNVDLDYSAQLGKNVRVEDIKYLKNHHSEPEQDVLTFFILVKNGKVVRLIKFDIQKEYVLKAIEKLKVQNAGTFSQLLPATLKISIHSLFQVEDGLVNLKASQSFKGEYIVTLESEDKQSLYVKCMNILEKTMVQLNIVRQPSVIDKIDISSQYPYYITVVDKKKKVGLTNSDLFLHQVWQPYHGVQLGSVHHWRQAWVGVRLGQSRSRLLQFGCQYLRDSRGQIHNHFNDRIRQPAAAVQPGPHYTRSWRQPAVLWQVLQQQI
jgi:hypothetical protein